MIAFIFPTKPNMSSQQMGKVALCEKISGGIKADFNILRLFVHLKHARDLYSNHNFAYVPIMSPILLRFDLLLYRCYINCHCWYPWLYDQFRVLTGSFIFSQINKCAMVSFYRGGHGCMKNDKDCLEDSFTEETEKKKR